VSALVIDSSSWSAYFRGKDSPLVEEALAHGLVRLPAIVAAELLSAKISPRRRRELESFLADLPLCGVEREHWFRVGALRSSLFAKGVSVSTPDAHVAQCAIDLQADLMTDDGVFAIIARHHPLQLVKG
jgi:predicted nucleic acid-binding protein